MKRVGSVVRTAQGLAVARAADPDELPRIGDEVIDEQLAERGRVVDVFGPLSAPYLAVSPNDDVHLPTLLGETLYAR
jgi:RNA-binding protein